MRGAGIHSECCDGCLPSSGSSGMRAMDEHRGWVSSRACGYLREQREGHLTPDDLLGYQLTIWPKIHQCGCLRVGLMSNKRVGTEALCSGVILTDSLSSLWTDANRGLVENHSNAPDLSSTSQPGDKAPSDPLEPIFKCPRTNRVPEPNGPPITDHLYGQRQSMFL